MDEQCPLCLSYLPGSVLKWALSYLPGSVLKFESSMQKDREQNIGGNDGRKYLVCDGSLSYLRLVSLLAGVCFSLGYWSTPKKSVGGSFKTKTLGGNFCAPVRN